MNTVTKYVLDTVERATRSGAAATLTAIGAASANIIGWNWQELGAAFAAGFIIETLISLAAQPVGDKQTPSILPTQGTTPAKLP